MPKQEKVKPSWIWYLLAVIFGILGGMIGYFAVKNEDRKMANKLLLTGFITTFVIPILFIFVLLGGASYSSSVSKAEYETKLKECQQEIIGLGKFVSCASCNPNLYVQKSCVIDNSFAADDCNSLLNYRYAKTDVDECLLTLARNLNKAEFCDKLGTGIYKNQKYSTKTCYLDVAVNLNDPTICNGMVECLKEFSSKKELETLCGNITSNVLYLRESCIIDKLKVALSTILEDNINICLKIFDEKYQPTIDIDGCTAIIALLQKNLNVCDQAGKQRVACYVVMAQEYDFVKLSDCDRLDANYLGCYSSIAIRTRDTSVCNKMPDYQKYNCLQNIALSTKNISICVQLQPVTGGGVDQGYCANTIYNEVKNNLTLDICDAGAKIQNINWVEECYFTIAKKTLNISLCDKSGRYTEECKTIVSHATG